MKLGRYVIVDDGGNYVASRAERFHKALRNNRELKQTTTTTVTRTSSNKRFNEQNNGYARVL